MPKLKPCPVCGSGAIVARYYDSISLKPFSCECRSCGCEQRGRTQYEADKSWNQWAKNLHGMEPVQRENALKEYRLVKIAEIYRDLVMLTEDLAL